MNEKLNLDRGTFGKDKVSLTIVSILNQKKNRTLIRRVNSLLTSVNKHLKNIVIKDTDIGTGDFLYHSIRAHMMNKIDKSLTLNSEDGKEVVTYVKNYVVTRLRRLLKK